LSRERTTIIIRNEDDIEISIAEITPPSWRQVEAADFSFTENFDPADFEGFVEALVAFFSLPPDDEDAALDLAGLETMGEPWGLNISYVQHNLYTRVVTNIEELYEFGATAIRETHGVSENYYHIIRTFRLPFDAPDVIRTEGFDMDGMTFEFSSIRPIGNHGITQMHYSLTVNIETPTSDINAILAAAPEFIHYQTEGYEGMLQLDAESLLTLSQDLEWERFYQTRDVVYEAVPFGDTSSFAVFFEEDSIAFSVYEIDWQSTGVASPGGSLLFDAFVTYRGWYSTSTTPGFITRATYEGIMFNFEHFPSALYEITFAARIEAANVEEIIPQPTLPGVIEAHDQEQHEQDVYASTQDTTQQAPPEQTTSGWPFHILIPAVLFFIVVGIGYLMYKGGLFGKLFSLFKKNKDEDELGDILESEAEAEAEKMFEDDV